MATKRRVHFLSVATAAGPNLDIPSLAGMQSPQVHAITLPWALQASHALLDFDLVAGTIKDLIRASVTNSRMPLRELSQLQGSSKPRPSTKTLEAAKSLTEACAGPLFASPSSLELSIDSPSMRKRPAL